MVGLSGGYVCGSTTPMHAPLEQAPAHIGGMSNRSFLTRLLARPGTQRALVVLIALAHTVAVVIAPAAYGVSWAVLVAPGVALCACSRRALRRWWVWLALWFVVSFSATLDVAALELVIGEIWIGMDWLAKRPPRPAPATAS